MKNLLLNNNFEILTHNNKFVDFHGIKKDSKDRYFHIELENNYRIDCSEDHLFIVNGKNIPASSLSTNGGYLSTIDGDFNIKKIELINKNIDLYDIVESAEDYQYVTNGIISHNCSFLGSGDNFIAEEFLQRIDEEEIETPIREENSDKLMWIFEDPEPETTYVMTIDASAGHGEDYSTINIQKIRSFIEEKEITKNGKKKLVKLKKNKIEQAAEYYGKVKPKELAEIAYVYGKAYNNALAIIDVTGGYGVNTIERLIELGYDNVYYSEISHKPTRDRLNGYIKKGKKKLPDGTMVDIDLIPGFFIGGNRGSILIELQRAINLSDCVIRSIRLLQELKTFVTVPGNRVADHKRSFHDDSIMGFALGIYVVNFDFDKYQSDPERDKKIISAMIKITSNDTIKTLKEEEKKLNENNKKTRVPEFRVTRNNPYGANAWLFKGL
jgi:hypothetical protein